MYAAINAWTLDQAESVEQQLEITEQAGFEGIELVVGPKSLLTPETPISECDRLNTIASDTGVTICGLATGDFWTRNYASPLAADRQAAIDLTVRMLDMAAALNAGAILIVPAVVGTADAKTPSVFYADALHHTLEALAELRHEAESRDVTIGVENVWNRFLLSPLEAADLIDRVNSPNVGIYLDTGNILPYGYPEDWIGTLGHRVVRVHAKDYDLSKPGFDGFVGLGEGDVNWPAVVAALDAVGYDGPLTFEGPGDPAEICKRLKAIIADDGDEEGEA